ncbi:Imm50 family immunity protein [Spirochaetia bacterium 38H-sp]|uniref:Imm50 family immunity protein n=1 Tax=Rarispira pelagica TaxID=3141764 RepID=A0ABU9UFI8_9SPIR
MNNDIIGKKIIEDYFGYFPTFHDCEIVELKFNRDKNYAEITLYVFDTAKETDDNGHFKKQKECFISFEIRNLEDMLLKGFNHQNVLERIRFVKTDDDKIKIYLDGCFGLSGYIKAEKVSVLSLKSKE